MIINSITLKNFRSYEDETTLSFTPKDKRNIVLIGGENGAGKSTLFEAIKLCIYGPTIYGYIGQNHNYLTKIKNNINDNAFKNDDVESFIALNMTFKDGTEAKEYSLKRSWKYCNQRLIESFSVHLNNKELLDEDKLYFDKYLKSVLPPTLFDFFFFDGEELSDFFTGKSANNSLKDSILELFNYDTFEVLKKQLLTYQRVNSKSNVKLDEAQQKFDEVNSQVIAIKEKISNLQSTILFKEEELENLLIKRNLLEDNFKNSGGIFEEERISLNSEINKIENERIEINQYIKDFCNDSLPFLLVPNLLEKLSKQIYEEDLLNSYNSIKDKLSGDVVMKAFKKNNIENNAVNFDEIALTIIDNMFNTSHLECVSNILELSNEERNSISFTLNNILTKKTELSSSLQSKFLRLKNIALSLKTLRDRLNSTISGDLLNSYLESLNILNQEITHCENTLAISKTNLSKNIEDLHSKEYTLTRAKNEYTSLLQNNNVLEISKNLINYLDELISNLTKDKISLIENEFIKIFSSIIRKDNYVNSIVIDDDFNVTLYINKEYDTNEILNIIKNLGFDGICKKYGPKFLEDLFSHFKVSENKDLEKALINNIFIDYINLSTKVNINDFSKGEKQIYILCLIWSIIKSSGVEIPFIIDTPYARIDETHRNSLTTDYLPNISKQVIILSTNKEIDSELYTVIKPYVCNEYLLLYNTEDRKTEVKNGYFEV